MTSSLLPSAADLDHDLDDRVGEDDDIEALLPATPDYEPATESPVSQDAGDNHNDDDQPPADSAANAGGDRSAGKASTKTAGPDRALIRRAALKAHELLQAPDSQIKLLAHLLGSTADPIELTVAVLAAPRTATRAATDLFEIAETEPMEAVLAVAVLPKDRFKALWSLLVALDEIKGAAPANDTKASLQLAKVAIKLTPSAATLLKAAVALAKRS